jgi:hypothetical protein
MPRRKKSSLTLADYEGLVMQMSEIGEAIKAWRVALADVTTLDEFHQWHARFPVTTEELAAIIQRAQAFPEDQADLADQTNVWRLLKEMRAIAQRDAPPDHHA